MPQKKAFLSFTFKKIKKVEFCFDILEAAFKRFLKSDEKMAFGTNGFVGEKIANCTLIIRIFRCQMEHEKLLTVL